MLKEVFSYIKSLIISEVKVRYRAFGKVGKWKIKLLLDVSQNVVNFFNICKMKVQLFYGTIFKIKT